MPEINLKKGQLKNISSGDKIAIVGMSGSGKTVILKAIMKRFERVPAIVVYTDTEDGNNNFGSDKNYPDKEPMIPDSYIFEEWDEDFASKLLERQKLTFAKLSPEEKEASLKGEITRASLLVILDDMGADSKTWGKSIVMKKFFMNGRQLGITTVITLQDPMDLEKKLRGQVNWAFLLKEKGIMKRKQLYEHYAGVIPYFDMFDQIMRNCTEDFGCIIVDNKSTSYDIDKSIYWYRAPVYPHFTMGSTKYRNQHARKYNSRYDRDRDNLPLHGRTKSKPKIRIIRSYRGEKIQQKKNA